MSSLSLRQSQAEENLSHPHTLTLPQLVLQKEETEAEVDSLCNLMDQLNKARLKYESTVEILNKMDESMGGKPALIPLSNTLYVPGEICKTNKFIVSLGKDHQMEVDKETAMNYFFRKIQRVKTKMGITQKTLATKVLDRERLRKAAADKYLEEKKKGDIKALPKFIFTD